MIVMEDVCFEYENKTRALNHINLKINNSEFVFIIGNSGAGKSSIFKLITREQVATTGRVLVDKQDLSKLARKQIPFFRRKIGMVFQDFRLIDHMTIFDNVAFVLRVTGYSNSYIKQRVPRVLEMVSLSNKANKMPYEISGGEQQRVAIARAIASNPPILIADEPTGNIDPALSYQIMKVLFDLNKYLQVTTIVVTHEHDIVNHFGKRVITIDKGKVKSDKVPQNSQLVDDDFKFSNQIDVDNLKPPKDIHELTETPEIPTISEEPMVSKVSVTSQNFSTVSNTPAASKNSNNSENFSEID